MKIGIVADTHMPRFAKKLPEALKKGLRDADMIIHAGDWQTLDVYEMFKEIAPVDGVTGNVDGEEIAGVFGSKKILTFGRFRIGVVHGHGKKKTTEGRAQDAFKEDDVDMIIFGHSHIPLHKERDGVILFNPGSPTDKRRQPQYSYGLLELGKSLQVRHVYYDDKK